MENIHLRFREIRLKYGLTQTEMANILGMKQPAWARLENGGVPDPRSSTIFTLCKRFNVDANWLLGLSVNTQNEGNITELADCQICDDIAANIIIKTGE